MEEVFHLVEEAELIADAILRRLQPVSDDLSTREAYKAYGRAWVENAVANKQVRRYFVGNRIVYSRTELDALRVLERRKGAPRVNY